MQEILTPNIMGKHGAIANKEQYKLKDYVYSTWLISVHAKRKTCTVLNFHIEVKSLYTPNNTQTR